MNFMKLTRIKGLRIIGAPPSINKDIDVATGNAAVGLRLLYSIDGCKWKIFGAKPKLSPHLVGNDTENRIQVFYIIYVETL